MVFKTLKVWKFLKHSTETFHQIDDKTIGHLFWIMHPTTYLLGALSKRELAVLSNDGESIFFSWSENYRYWPITIIYKCLQRHVTRESKSTREEIDGVLNPLSQSSWGIPKQVTITIEETWIMTNCCFLARGGPPTVNSPSLALGVSLLHKCSI